MYTSWLSEFWRLSMFLLAGAIFGMLTERFWESLFVATIIYVIWQFRRLHHLIGWIRKGDRSSPPDLDGMMGEVVHHIYRRHQRDRKRKKKLSKLLARFSETSSAMPDATVILGGNGEIEWFNDAAKHLLGLRSQDTGRWISNLIRHPQFTEYLRKGDFAESVGIPAPHDEEIMLNIRIVPYGNHQRLLTARDMTRLHRLEVIRRDFVGNVSHELRTPLTVIGGYLESLVDGEDLTPEEMRSSLRQMQQQTQRMRSIIEDLLKLSRLEGRPGSQEDFVNVSVPALIAGLVEEATILIGSKGHELHVEKDDDLWLQGAADELHSAFSNLLSNAVRYTPQGGVITLRWYADDAGAHFEVEDTGPGIDPQHIPRLTERFYRVDKDRSRDYGGTGLGLAIVKHVLQHHDAKLRIKSRVGQGSTFICDFPSDAIVRRGDGPRLVVSR